MTTALLRDQSTAEEMYEVHGVEKTTWNDLKRAYNTEPAVRLMSESDLEGHRKYDCFGFKPQTTLPLGKLWPAGTTVEETDYLSDHTRCLTTARYLVTSPKALSKRDFEVLRAQGCFVGGQECGIVRSEKRTATGWEYVLTSYCDSGD